MFQITLCTQYVHILPIIQGTNVHVWELVTIADLLLLSYYAHIE